MRKQLPLTSGDEFECNRSEDALQLHFSSVLKLRLEACIRQGYNDMSYRGKRYAQKGIEKKHCTCHAMMMIL